jgi:hypothetical protein
MFVFNTLHCTELRFMERRPRLKVPVSTSGQTTEPEPSVMIKCDLLTIHNANQLCPRPVGVSYMR